MAHHSATFGDVRRAIFAPRGLLQGSPAYAISAPDQPGSIPHGASRRGGRVVECTALEMRRGGDSTGGSNPSLSASFQPVRRIAKIR